MKGKSLQWKLTLWIVWACFILSAACAEVKFRTIPTPPSAAKLGVLVIPVSGPAPHGGWLMSHEEWARSRVGSVRRILENMGIYELPKKRDVEAALGKKKLSWNDWRRNHWGPAREAGQAIRADYTLIIQRNFYQSNSERSMEVILINVESGRKYSILFRTFADRWHAEDWRNANRIAVREIFQMGKEDMLATALRKGRLGSTPDAKPPLATPEASLVQPVPREVDLEALLKAEQKKVGQPRLAVYDFEAVESLRIAALIFSEALREELSRLGFTLVNRENITKVLEEMALQQTGLVDEKEAVQAGKGLAAQHIVMGRFATLGKTSVLQAKRVDIETQGTVGLASLNCPMGKEEELMARIPELARKLAAKP